MDVAFMMHRVYYNTSHDPDIGTAMHEWPPLESSTKSRRRKGEELAGILDERFYAVIFTTSSRQPHRRGSALRNETRSGRPRYRLAHRRPKDPRWSRTRISIRPLIKRSSSFGMLLFRANSPHASSR